MSTEPPAVEPAAPSAHAVQLFDDARSRAGSAAAYLAEGWYRGETLLVVAAAVHWVGISEHLERRGVGVVAALASGRLTVRDVGATLDQFRSRDRIDASGFDRVVGGLVRELVAARRPLRIFGEMVDWLAGGGDFAAAEELERLWNGLARQVPFRLLCGYSAGTFGDPRSRASLRRICHAHDEVRTHPADLLGSFLLASTRPSR
jgi:hypothetical protein